MENIEERFKERVAALLTEHGADRSIEQLVSEIAEGDVFTNEEKQAIFASFTFNYLLHECSPEGVPFGIPLGDEKDPDTVWTAPKLCTPAQIRAWRAHPGTTAQIREWNRKPRAA
jgi:hypothetical protein